MSTCDIEGVAKMNLLGAKVNRLRAALTITREKCRTVADLTRESLPRDFGTRGDRDRSRSVFALLDDVERIAAEALEP